MSDHGTSQEQSVPIDQYPDPALCVDTTGEHPVAHDHNTAFTETFGVIDGPVALERVLDRFDIIPLEDGANVSAAISHPDPPIVSVTVGDSGRQYLLRPVPAESNETTGYLLFVDTDAIGETGGSVIVGADQVASVVSHDLRNPLDVAKARLRAGQETGNGEHFDHVERAHNRMERIIQDVLTLARGSDSIDPDGSVELGSIVEHAWESVETNGVQLTVSDSLPSVTADQDRAERLFENLFRNAIEHGGDTTAITVGRVENGVFVADDGVGIEPEDRSRVFEPGYSTMESGTGLGLAIVEGIAHAHGWSVTASEAESGGTRIDIRDMDSARLDTNASDQPKS